MPRGIIERVVEDRQARMAGSAEMRKQLVQRRLGRDGDNVGARDHHVGNAALAQAQHIGEHRAFLGGEVGELAILLRQGLDDFLAGGAAAAQAEAIEKLAEPMAEATRFILG
jgi:hypothetical protein